MNFFQLPLAILLHLNIFFGSSDGYAVDSYSPSLGQNFMGLKGVFNSTNKLIFQQAFMEELNVDAQKPNPFTSLLCSQASWSTIQTLGSATAQMLRPSCIAQFSTETVRALLNSRRLGVSGKSHVFENANLKNVQDFKEVVQGIYKNDLDWASIPGKFAILNATETQLGDGKSLLTIVNKWNNQALIEYSLHSLAKGMNYHFLKLFDSVLPSVFEIIFSTAILPEIECKRQDSKPMCALVVQSAIETYSENLRLWPSSVRRSFQNLIPALPTTALRNYGRKQFVSLMKLAEPFEIDLTQKLAIIDEAFGDWMESPATTKFLPYLGRFTPSLFHTQVFKWFRQQAALAKGSSREIALQLHNLLPYSPNFLTLKAFESQLIGRGNLANFDKIEEVKAILPLLSMEEMQVISQLKFRDFQQIHTVQLSPSQKTLIAEFLTGQISTNNDKVVVKENLLEPLAKFLGHLSPSHIKFESSICAKLDLINSIADSLRPAHKLMITETCRHAKFVEYNSDLLEAMNESSLRSRITDLKVFDLQFDRVQGFMKTGSSMNVVDMELSPALSRLVFIQFREFLGDSKMTGQIARSLKKVIRGLAPSDIERLSPFYFFDVIFVYLDETELINRKLMQTIAQKLRSVWWILYSQEFDLGKLSDLQIKSFSGPVFREFKLEEFTFERSDKCNDVFMKIGQTNPDLYSVASSRVLAELYLTQCKQCSEVESCSLQSQDILIMGKLVCFLPAKILESLPNSELKRNLDFLQSCRFVKSQGLVIRKKLGDLSSLNFDQISSLRNSLCSIFEAEEIGSYLADSMSRYDRLHIWNLFSLEMEKGNLFGDLNASGNCVSIIRTMLFVQLARGNEFESSCNGPKLEYNFVRLIPVEIFSPNDIHAMSECQFNRFLEHSSNRLGSLDEFTKQAVFKRGTGTGNAQLSQLRPEELLRLKEILPPFVSPVNMSQLNFSDPNIVYELSKASWTKNQLNAGFDHYLATNKLSIGDLTEIEVKSIGSFLCGIPTDSVRKLPVDLLMSDSVLDSLDCPESGILSTFVRFHSTSDDVKLVIRPIMLAGLTELSRISKDIFSAIPNYVFEKLTFNQLITIRDISDLTPSQAQFYIETVKIDGYKRELMKMIDPLLSGTEYEGAVGSFDSPMLMKFNPEHGADKKNQSTSTSGNAIVDGNNNIQIFGDGEMLSRVIYITVSSASTFGSLPFYTILFSITQLFLNFSR